MPPGWRHIGAERSEHQPGLLLFGRLLEDHLRSGPTVAQTLWWLVARFVLAAHESIAYSKLPNYTFRFRWERGRLRFFDPGDSRIDITDNRRDALSRLSRDLGLWGPGPDGTPRLSSVGRMLVEEVFG
jgi:hypothetical protein